MPVTSALTNNQPTMPDPINTREILQLIGQGSDLPALDQFLVKHRVHDRPKTVLQLKDEEALDEDDDDMDVEYELEKMSQDSQHVFSERYSFSLIFKTKSEYELIYGPRPDINADFVLEEVVFYAKETRGQGYPAQLPGGVYFGVKRRDAAYQRLGQPVARRLVYDSQTDLFAIDNIIVNFGFDDHDTLAHVHVRWMHAFDRVMLSAVKSALAHTEGAPIGAGAIGDAVHSDKVQALLAALEIDADELDDGACPEEITSQTQARGITLYFRDLPLSSKRGKKRNTTQHLAAIAYKRRGDLQSEGFQDVLPFGFQFGDSPETLKAKAMEPPGIEHSSDQLMSYFWETESGMIVQAMCSLIDWQLYRVTLHAAFLADEIGFSAAGGAR